MYIFKNYLYNYQRISLFSIAIYLNYPLTKGKYLDGMVN